MHWQVARYRCGVRCLCRLAQTVMSIAVTLLLLNCKRELPEPEDIGALQSRVDRIAGTPHGAWWIMFDIPVEVAPGRDSFVVVNNTVLLPTDAQLAVAGGFRRGPIVLVTSPEATGAVWTKETGLLPFVARRTFREIQHTDGVVKVTKWCNVRVMRDDKASSASLRVSYIGPADI
jgi:hypothetical protein